LWELNRFNVSLVISILMLVLLFSIKAPTVFIVCFLVLVLSFWFLMSLCIRCNFFIKSINHTVVPNVVLSFDDGPHPEITPRILDILKLHEVQALFFVIGKNIQGNEEIIERIVSEGHLIGSHSYNHPNLMGVLSVVKVREEIKRGHDELSRILKKPSLLFRPPVGVTNPNIARAIVQLNIQSVGWSLRSLDTVFTSKERILKRLLRKVKGGDIVLLHDTKEITLEMLEEFIVAIKQKKLVLKAKLS